MSKLYEVRVSAPGKVILHGEHAVMFGKMAIAGSLGLRSSIYIKEHNSDVPSLEIKLASIKLDTTIKLEPVNEILLQKSQSSWREPHSLQHDSHMENSEGFLTTSIPHFENLNNYQKNALRGFFYLLSGIFGKMKLDKSFEVLVESELTIGAGTGSSASYAVCLAGALLQLAKLKSGCGNKDFSDEDKELISAWAYNSEKIMHGAPSGIDNSTATFGSLVSLKKGEGPKHLDFNIDLRVLLVNTQVSRETRTIAARVAHMRSWNGDAVDSIMDAIGHVSDNAAVILKNLSQASSEVESKKQYQRLSALWDMNHSLLAALGVSHPALEAIRVTCAAHALACKLTGAGGGGYAIVLVAPATTESTVQDLKNDLTKKGFLVTDTTLGGRGVTLDVWS